MAGTELRTAIRAARKGNPYRYREPSGPVPVGPLIHTLRYDVLIRVRYYEYYAQHRQRFREDLDAYADQAREHDYWIWFAKIFMCPPLRLELDPLG